MSEIIVAETATETAQQSEQVLSQVEIDTLIMIASKNVWLAGVLCVLFFGYKVYMKLEANKGQELARINTRLDQIEAKIERLENDKSTII